MSILDELRYPRRWYTKLLTVLLALLFFALLATAAIAGVLTYWIVKPQRTSSEINMASFPGRPDEVDFEVSGLKPADRKGWFFPGLRGAPTIILCHGYQSSRGELLTLVSALQDHQYNVFVFDFAAHGSNDGYTTFGYREADEVRAAVDVIARRTDVDPMRFGLWGYNLGAYAALREAEKDNRVRAMVLDSVYDNPKQMVKIGVEKTGVGGFPMMVRSAQTTFEWLNYAYKDDPPLSARLKLFVGVPILFIQATDDPELASITRQMFLKTPEPREQAIIAHGNFVNLPDEEKREYENRVVAFFLTRLPISPVVEIIVPSKP
ncbi:MAG TPA: alpha/beta fold hydrolase, partial [Candidatus Limnocylindrales bacterium]|nr:alpha/beta fold hydrolase [Candidatus Limnocylindrales bacterium]